MSTATIVNTETQTRPLGYQDFSIGQFSFRRDEYFANVSYPRRNAHHPDRRVPALPDARRSVGLFLRYCEFR